MTDAQREHLRAAARRIFARTLRAIDVRDAVRRHLAFAGSRLRVGENFYEFAEFTQVMVIAIGKAAAPMAEAAAEVLCSHITGAQRWRAVVVGTKAPVWDSGPLASEVTYFPGAHPTPNANSRDAADTVLTLLREAGDRTLVLFLISGGASAMLEAPFDENISVEDTADFYRALVASGLAIGEINTLRKQLSAVKGGRLAQAAGAAVQLSLIVSDVPGNALDMVASGPTLPDTSTVEEVRALFDRLRQSRPLPPHVERFFAGEAWAQGRVQPADPAFARAAWVSVLSSEHLQEAASEAARGEGFRVQVDNTCDDWEAGRAARYLLERSLTLAKGEAQPSCLLSVGELCVEIDRAPGEGGRNQHFALECALALDRSGDDAVVLSAGSDGADGNSDAAGAIADSTTCGRAAALGIDAIDALRSFSSGSLFRALGDDLVTGPTGNNLRDLRLVLRVPKTTRGTSWPSVT